MTRVLDRVQRTIDQNHLLVPGEPIVVGVSGGPDSLCLLHILCRLKGIYDLTLHVAHLNHGMRGAEADADADFVRKLAADWNLLCTIEQTDVPALARRHRLAVEEAARRARYAFLSRLAETVGAQTIAVGHNADDQTETVLMHWVRGSGLAGLRGMLPLTPLDDYRLLEYPSYESLSANTKFTTEASLRCRLIRPLLEVPRADIEAYCAFYGLEARFDRSNLDTTYFRNWLRHEVIPLLERHNPNVREVIRRSARVIGDDYVLLRSLLEKTWPSVVLEESAAVIPSPRVGDEGHCRPPGARIVFNLAAWRALPTSLQRSTLREAIHRLRWSLRNINFVHVENALHVARDGTTGDQATLPRGLVLTVGYEQFYIADVDMSEALPERPFLLAGSKVLPVNVPGGTVLPGSAWMLSVEVVRRDELPAAWKSNVDPWRAFLDAAIVGDGLWLRTRRPGDRFQPLGLGGHQAKLGDFLTNQKVPRVHRDRLPLLVGDKGIMWVCGQRVDEQARVRETTEWVLVLQFVQG
jgi:tRNA(Ile)-lysidine synthase